MKIVKEPQYRCDMCGHTDVWDATTWIAHTFPITSISGWEHEFHCCQYECSVKLADMTRKERKTLAIKISRARNSMPDMRL